MQSHSPPEIEILMIEIRSGIAMIDNEGYIISQFDVIKMWDYHPSLF